MSVQGDGRWRAILVDADGDGAPISGVTEIADSLGDGPADKPAAFYQLADGRYCLFVHHPAQPAVFGPGAQAGSAYMICATRADAESAATAMGVAVRLGIQKALVIA